MSELTKANLWVLKQVSAGGNGVPPKVERGEKYEVPLNPTSLRIERRNNVDRGAVTAGAQRRQHAATEGATLSFDLEFDTSDLDAGVDADVRRQTAKVLQFTTPPEDDRKAAPPRVEFQWGTLIIAGIMTQATEEIDYFSPEGRPLRAKVSVSITEQDLRLEKNEAGAGLKNANSASAPGNRSPTGPGGSGTHVPDTQVKANDGESAQQLASRLGGDPTAWRSLMNGLDSPLNLAAGTTVEVGPEVMGGSSIGVSTGFGSGLPPTSSSSLSAALQPTARFDAGFVIAEVGGVTAAAQVVESAAAQQSIARARAAFVVPGGAVRPQGAPDVDPRSLSYGASIPLTLRLPSATRLEIEAGGGRTVSGRVGPAEVSLASSSAALAWIPLPPDVSRDRQRADAEQRRRDARS